MDQMKANINLVDADWFLHMINGEFKGFEQRCTTNYFIHNVMLEKPPYNTASAFTTNRAIDCVVISIPVDTMPYLINSFRKKTIQLPKI